MKRDGDRIRQQCDEDRTVHFISVSLYLKQISIPYHLPIIYI